MQQGNENTVLMQSVQNLQEITRFKNLNIKIKRAGVNVFYRFNRNKVASAFGLTLEEALENLMLKLQI